MCTNANHCQKPDNGSGKKKTRTYLPFYLFLLSIGGKIKQAKNGHEVRFIDLRYRSKGHYPFIAVVHLDRNLNIIHSYTGWVYNKNRLKRRLKTADKCKLGIFSAKMPIPF